METIRICNLKEQLMGELGITENGSCLYKTENDPVLEKILSDAFQFGVVSGVSVYDEARNVMLHELVTVKCGEVNFVDALSKKIGHKGYRLVRDDYESKEIINILHDYPINNPDKQDILYRLPVMSKLEKSLLLIELRNKL